jgi:hypothetical protein
MKERELRLLKTISAEEFTEYGLIRKTSSAKIIQRAWRKLRTHPSTSTHQFFSKSKINTSQRKQPNAGYSYLVRKFAKLKHGAGYSTVQKNISQEGSYINPDEV